MYPVAFVNSNEFSLSIRLVIFSLNEFSINMYLISISMNFPYICNPPNRFLSIPRIHYKHVSQYTVLLVSMNSQ